MSHSENKLTFFRQSGWMVIAATSSGVFMLGVHFYNQWMPKGVYGAFGTMLVVMTWLQCPVIGVQQTMAQTGAAALTEADRRRLAYTARRLLLWSFLLWLALAAAAFLCLKPFMDLFHVRDTRVVGLLLVLALVNFWTPICQGLLQGAQNFLWLGWSSMLSGVGRFAVVGIFVVGLKSSTAGIMMGILAGALVPFAISAWQSRSVWLGAEERAPLGPWFQNLIPLTLCLAASQIIFITDLAVVSSLFPDLSDPYTALATLGRALVTFTAPVAAVMFPKIVSSAARSEKSNAFMLAFGITSLLAGCAAIGLSLIGLTVVGQQIFQVVFRGKAELVSLLPLYAWCILPQAIGNVLLGDLLARRRFGIALPLLVLAAVYLASLASFNDSIPTLIKTLGVASLAYLLITAGFAWWDLQKRRLDRS